MSQTRLEAAGLAGPDAKTKNYPGLDRALVGLYPPGSTFKPVTALAAMQEHIISPYTQLLCSGSYTAPEDLSRHKFQNWDPNVSQWMDLTTALAYSCDTYFYQLGDDFYTLQPGRYVMGYTYEAVVIPAHLAGRVEGDRREGRQSL